MLSMELKLAAVITAASILLSYVSYKILLAGSYLAGIEALGLVVLAVVVSSLAFHVRHTRKVSLPAISSVRVEIASAASAPSGNGILFPAVAGSFAVVVLLGVVATGETQRQVTPEMPRTCSQFSYSHRLIDLGQ